VRTEMNETLWETENGQRLIQSLPRQRVGGVEDLDGLILLLSSDESQMINGAVIAIDDGASVA
jgi:NAD(P)-dependent dehydrogenase (short-subunit alcohol dehydrogenase family)